MIRQTSEPMVRAMGVKMQAKRPALPMVAVGGGTVVGWGVCVCVCMLIFQRKGEKRG